MERKENLEIKKAPEELTKQDLEKVTGGLVVAPVCAIDDGKSVCTKKSCTCK